jgi:uncharacterized repeat protein (TIGR01451 family)
MLRRLGGLWLLSTALFTLLWISPPVSSVPGVVNTLYVDPVNGNDVSGTGSAATPWRSIKRALQTAASGDTINALPGTYSTATGEVFPINWLPGVKLVGAGRDVSIIQGQSNQPVIYIGSASTDFYSDTVISGVTVRGGSEGIYLYSSQNHVNATTLLNLRAISNTDGIRIRTSEIGENGAAVTPLISNVEALSNTNDGFYFSGYGYYSPASVRPQVVNCAARGNGAHGLYIDSAAVSSNGTTVAPHVVQSDFSYNQGSGIYATASYQGWASPQIERSTLIGNGAYGFAWVQGFNFPNAVPNITNTLIARNQAGGLYLGNINSYYGLGTIGLINDTIVDNQHYGIYWVPDGHPLSPHVVNTMLWNPEADDLFSTSTAWTTAQVEYSDIEDGDFNGQAGNFSADPLLDETYHLIACSPAIDAGTLNGVPSVDFDGESRPQGTAPDVGYDESNTPCVLRSAKTVSASQARYGDVLTYTLQITNVTPITTMNVILTDVLPAAVSYVPASLTASQGMPDYQSGIVTWTGDLVPSDTVTISLAARVAHGKTTVKNYFQGTVAGYGLFKSQTVTTTVDPILCYLPLIYRNYCSGPVIDDFSNPASGWPIAETAYWSYGYTGGEYRFYAKQSAFGAVSRGDKTGRFIVEVDARQVSAVSGSFGIVFQLNDDWSDLYTFEIFPATQQWAIFRRLGGQWSLLTYGTSSAIQPGYNTNRLRIAWLQQTVSFDDYGFYINGQPVFSSSFIYAPTPVRRVGLTATSDGAGFDVRFDHYKFVPEGCPEFPATHLSRPAALRRKPLAADNLPAVWQDRLRAKNSAIPHLNSGKSLFSEGAH